MQEFESLVKSPMACAALTAAESAVADGTVEDIKHTAVSLRKVVRPMLVKMVDVDVIMLI